MSAASVCQRLTGTCKSWAENSVCMCAFNQKLSYCWFRAGKGGFSSHQCARVPRQKNRTLLEKRVYVLGWLAEGMPFPCYTFSVLLKNLCLQRLLSYQAFSSEEEFNPSMYLSVSAPADVSLNRTSLEVQCCTLITSKQKPKPRK